MSNSKPSNTSLKFWIIAGVVLALSSALIVSAVPQIGKFRIWEAQQLVGKARVANQVEAEADYRLAYRLNPSNSDAALHFAIAQTNQGNPDAALVILNKADTSREVEVAKIRAGLEAGKIDVAVSSADKLLTLKPTQNDVVLAAAAYGMADTPAQALALMPLVSSPEALQGVQRASADKLALASVLAAEGLQKSASSLLVKIPNSVPRALLMAKILIDQNTTASLGAAADYLLSGTIVDPSNQEVRVQLISVLKKLKRNDEATAQQVLLDKLIAGRV